MKRLVAALGTAALLAVGVAAALVIRDAVRPDCAFSDTRWAEAKRLSTYSDARFEAFAPLAQQLVHCHDLLNGRSPKAVRAMLGPPDHRASEPREWSWEIGIPPPRSDYSPLTVRFGSDGLVDEVRVPGFIEP